MPATPSESSTSWGDGPAKNPQRLDARDVAALLELMADLACQRSNARRWRHEMLTRLLRLLPATAAAAFIVKVDADLTVTQVVSAFDAGFKTAAHHQAFLDEINDVPFQDPLAKKCLRSLVDGAASTFTADRPKFVEDAAWYGSAIVERYRRPAGIDHCLLSMQRGTAPSAGRQGEDPGVEGGGQGRGDREVRVVCAFRAWGNPEPFTARERVLLDTFHQGLTWMYRAEGMLQRLTRATALTPRLRQTLDFLLAGDTERQVAVKMRISIHTVHDYVKALYVHFGVSSRGELLARWIQSGELLPAMRPDAE